jgi:hypothetical protein
VATTASAPAPPPAETHQPEEEAAREPPAPAEPASDGPPIGLHLHRRDESGLRPDDVVSGSGAPPAPLPGPSVELGEVSGVSDAAQAARVIATLRSGFRRCYSRALQADPAMTGAFTLEAKVGPGGDVVGVTVKGPKGTPTALTACLEAVFRRAQLAPPPGGAATLVVPINIARP